MPEEVKISVEAVGAGDEIVKIRVDGILDTLTSPQLEKVMNSLIDQERYSIMIDLAGVDYISSAGWGIFISHLKEIREKRGDLKLARMLPQVYEIFELLEFDSILKAYDSIEDARLDFIQNKKVELKVSEFDQAEKRSLTFKQPLTREVNQALIPAEGLSHRIKTMIISDPFLSLGEIVRKLNYNNTDSARVGFWKVFNILRKNRLLRKQNRFKLSWKETKT
ncbi:MAG: hypothetical protein A2145_00390 [candidate division Zixibacteria bacterium RBG_16_40_9]|nr:MAG: hypothetical protein A2145_00390 [candidate division Zixibacteria bacterium RBG_16_40_9]